MVAAAAIIVAAPAAIFAATAVRIATYGPPQPRYADAAIVLGAAAWGAQPSPVLAARVDHAIDLYRQKRVRRLLFTGGARQASDPTEAAVAARYARERGEAILTEARPRSTWQNLVFAREIASGSGITTVLIVSDPLHLFRAERIATDLGLAAATSATPYTRYRRLGSRATLLARETYKYLKYCLGGGRDSPE